VAVLVGIGCGGLARRPRLTVFAEAGMLAILVLLDHWSVPGRAAEVPAGVDLPPVYGWLAQDVRTPLVELPLYPSRARKQWAAYLYFSTYHWRPIPIGRTSFYPPAHEFLVRMLEGFPDDGSLAALDRLGIDTVVVHPRVWSDEERTVRQQAVDAQPRLRLVQAFAGAPDPRFSALALGDERVYRLTGPAPPWPRPCVPADPLPGGVGAELRSVNNARVRDGDRRRRGTPAAAARGRLPRGPAGRARTVAAVGLRPLAPYDELPGGGGGEDEEGGRRRVEIADGPAERRAVLDALLETPREAEWALRFPPLTARAVRIQVGWREPDPSWPAWSVPELQLYRSCR
jgi:hypothetical protein